MLEKQRKNLCEDKKDTFYKKAQTFALTELFLPQLYQLLLAFLLNRKLSNKPVKGEIVPNMSLARG